ncbi:MAG: DUF3429 domain-containing protein [Pseudomonadota bacterium]
MFSPALPIALGAAGLIPFVGAALGSVLLPDFLKPLAFYAALAYGVAILAFLGGVHWGIALGKGGSWRFVWSVIPSLIGFFAVLAPRPVALGTLCAGFVLAGIVDVLVFRRDGPVWYLRLRIALTVIVAAALAFTASEATVVRVDPFGTIVR